MSLVAHLRGVVIDRGPDQLVVEVGGVGIRVFCSPALAARTLEGAEVALHTHLQLREDLMALYGFESRAELRTFETLIGVSGVGPRVGLTLLSTLGSDRLGIAIAGSDVTALTRVPGIGKKIAERIIVDLREKFRDAPPSDDGFPMDGGGDEVVAALVALGYSTTEAAEAARRASAKGGSTEEQILTALRTMDSN
ncbi:MAG: Holliday junction branch migration protein RuvA [Dehalococcoidia bacterium]